VLSLPARTRVYACTVPVDFRKQHDGLVAIVRGQLASDPLDGSVFVFFNRRRDRIKLLLWDANGFWLFYKRLERGTFERLRDGNSDRLQITRAELSMLLDGIDVSMSKKRKHFADEISIVRRARRDGDVEDGNRHLEASR
jgi:transposase